MAKSIPISGFFSAACVKCPVAGNSTCNSFKAAVNAGHEPDDIKKYVSLSQEGVNLADGCSNSEAAASDDDLRRG